MPPKKNEQMFDRIREHAFNSLSFRQQETTNLYLEQKVYKKGQLIGPAFQKITARKTSVLVFADDHPSANFGHDCRYLLYDAENGDLHSEVPARFPPWLKAPSETLRPFHQPVRLEHNPNLFHVRPFLRCPILFPDGNRYAILYSGMSNKRHLNDLEFCYRMLIDRYGFDKNKIYVLTYDGTLNTQDGVQTNWPGDNTPYRIHVNNQGNKAAFKAVFNTLKGKLKANDLLFIHTNNHGDNNGTESFLCTYPSWGTYMASEFCADLATLPQYRSLIVMMEQCNSGGFNLPVLAASTANNSSIASAAIATQSSYVSADGNWDPFARDWIAAQAGHTAFGTALAHNPDGNGNGVIEAEEAYEYALSVQDPRDSPNFNESSEAGGDITLGQHYIFWWWWCYIIYPILVRYYRPLPPDPEWYEKIQVIMPELSRLVVPGMDRAAVDMRKEVSEKVEEVVRKAIGKNKK